MPLLNHPILTRRAAVAAAVPATLLVSVLVASLPASASQNGRPGFSGNPAINGGATCTVCHAPTGAALPAVSLNGPTVLDAATSFDFTVTLSGGPAVTGGVNISVVDTNGVPIGALQPLDGDLQVAGDELTHTAPKSFVGDEVTFSFRFTAPDYDVEGSIYVAGNASNGALNLIGDGVDAGSWPITIENGFAPPPPPPPPPSNPELSADVFATGLTLPVAIANAGDERLFVVEQPGRIRIINPDGFVRSAPFLDIEAQVDDTNGEMGLLGLSFHPDYANNGYFYVYYTRDPGPGLDRTRVSRFTVSADPDLGDPASELVLLEFEQPYSNHNGGDLHFGPDGYLYIASGDGGSGGDPQDNAQDPDRLLGKLLRIDVDTSAGNGPDCDVSGAGNYFIPAGNAYNDGPGGVGCDEVYALGLRNPWRFSFDPTTGDIWIGDVGQNNKEEINRIPAGSAGGLNLGWRCYEGNQPYNLDGCDGAYLFPVYDFSHGNGSCSVTGGVVYRGAEYPELDGEYIFSDFCNTSVRALAGPLGAPVVREVLPANVVAAPSAFGTDTGGEIYVASLYSGILYRLRSADSDGDGGGGGIMAFEFTSGNEIYDISSIHDCETMNVLGIPTTLCLDVDMVPDGKGKHIGSASIEFSGDITGRLVGPASGSVKGTAGVGGKAKLKFAATGGLNTGSVTSASEAKVKCKGGINPTGFLSLLCSVKVKIEGAGSEKAKVEFNDQLNGGTWTLSIDVDPVDEKNFSGTGMDSLGYAYTVSGKYSSKSDTSKVKATGLKGTASNGAKVLLKGLTAGGAAEAKFKVQGYKGVTAVQAAP